MKVHVVNWSYSLGYHEECCTDVFHLCSGVNVEATLLTVAQCGLQGLILCRRFYMI